MIKYYFQTTLQSLLRERHALMIFSLLQVVLAGSCFAQGTVAASGHRATRLIWQDRSDDQLKWADLYVSPQWRMTTSPVSGFPKLDKDKQDMVQMKILNGTLLVGVRDQQDGEFQSGWVAVDTGVREEPHGNHSHWKYVSAPKIQNSVLDKTQGNPAHLYAYNGTFYLANDRRNGFTQLVPASLQAKKSGRFFTGGGNHITMAIANNKVGYSTWIDGGGPNKGRVDVVNLQQASGAPAYSFHLPTGAIHGATVNSNRVFFAPADGVCWTNVDPNPQQQVDVKVHHLKLGTDKETDKPLRTGAFANHRNWVLFVTGSADSSALCLVDAAAPTPKVIKIPIPVADGLRLVTPAVVKTRSAKRYAFVFHDRTGSDISEKLTVIDLDPNRDRHFADARMAVTMPIGASKVEGHYGHHSVCFDPDGRYACVANPGDGTIDVISLRSLQMVARMQVGGSPSAVTCVGGGVHHHH